MVVSMTAADGLSSVPRRLVIAVAASAALFACWSAPALAQGGLLDSSSSPLATPTSGVVESATTAAGDAAQPAASAGATPAAAAVSSTVATTTAPVQRTIAPVVDTSAKVVEPVAGLVQPVVESTTQATAVAVTPVLVAASGAAGSVVETTTETAKPLVDTTVATILRPALDTATPVLATARAAGRDATANIAAPVQFAPRDLAAPAPGGDGAAVASMPAERSPSEPTTGAAVEASHSAALPPVVRVHGQRSANREVEETLVPSRTQDPTSISSAPQLAEQLAADGSPETIARATARPVGPTRDFPGSPGGLAGSTAAAFGSGSTSVFAAVLAAAFLLAALGAGRRLRLAETPWPLPILFASLERPG